MTLTAKTTTAALKTHVFSLIKDAGFDDWTGRKAWRRRAGCIDTVEFRSVSSYDAQVMGCSTASLSVWFGSWPDCFLPAQYPLKQGPKGPRPNEYEMPLRGHLAPSGGMAVRMSPQIWDVRTEDDAIKAAQDIAAQLQDAALAWLSIEWDAQELLDHLRASSGHEDPIHSSTTGARISVACGKHGSPANSFFMAQLEQSLGRYAAAADLYEKSRYALNHTTQEMRLFRDPDEDALIADLAAQCRAKA